MAGERGRWRAVVGVGWIVVAGACSGGADSNALAVPRPQSSLGSTAVLDQLGSDPSPAETPPPVETLPPVETTPSDETPPRAEPPRPVETPPPVETLSQAPAESFTPVQPLQPGTPDAGTGGAAGEHGLEAIDSAPPLFEPEDAGAPLAKDASSAAPVPGSPPVETLPPPESEPAAPPPTDVGAPPAVVSEPPAPSTVPPPSEPPPSEPPPSEPPPPTSFQTEVWPIFTARCASCHGTRRAGGHSVGSLVLAIAYADAGRLGSTLIERLDGGGMPPSCSGQPGDPGCITVAELAAIQRWLDTGMAP